MTKKMVAYFSAGGNTKKVAQKLAGITNADIYEIKPLIPYTDADLNWMDKNSRSTLEMKNPDSRPEIVDTNAKIEDYDVIFLGFPIWWYVAPTIINTFLEKYDFSNKRIILFATSGGSGFGNTVRNLTPSVSSECDIVEGKLFNPNVSDETIKEWIEKMQI